MIWIILILEVLAIIATIIAIVIRRGKTRAVRLNLKAKGVKRDD